MKYNALQKFFNYNSWLNLGKSLDEFSIYIIIPRKALISEIGSRIGLGLFDSNSNKLEIEKYMSNIDLKETEQIVEFIRKNIPALSNAVENAIVGKYSVGIKNFKFEDWTTINEDDEIDVQELDIENNLLKLLLY